MNPEQDTTGIGPAILIGACLGWLIIMVRMGYLEKALLWCVESIGW